MPAPWRQGSILFADEWAGVIAPLPGQAREQAAIIITHSCDLESSAEIEPDVDLIIGPLVTEDDAKCRNGHSIRTLHLKVRSQEPAWLECDIRQRTRIAKTALPPVTEAGCLNLKERGILQRWLAQRYNRAALPNQFVEWLKATKLLDKVDKWMRKHTKHLVGLYIDLHGDESERTDPDEPYVLVLDVVYDGDDDAFIEPAMLAAAELNARFRTVCFVDAQWRYFEVVECEAVSDLVFSLRAARVSHRWRSEHHSLNGEPLDDSE